MADGNYVLENDVKSILGETGSDYDTVITLSIFRAEGAVRRFLKYDPVRRSRTEYYPQSASRDQPGKVLEATETSAVFTSPETVRGSELQLMNIPVRTNVAIQLFVDYDARAGTKANAFPASTEKTEGTDYWANYDSQDSDGNKVCRDGIIRSFGLWPIEPGSIKVVYTAGYTDNELRGQDSVIDASPIWDAALDEAVNRARRAIVQQKSATLGYAAGPKIEERLGDYRYRISDRLSRELFGVRAFSLFPENIDKLQEFVHMGFDL